MIALIELSNLISQSAAVEAKSAAH
jgi:hypothetical protein